VRNLSTSLIVLAIAALSSHALLSTASAAPSAAPGPIPRLAEFRIKTHGSGYEELIIRFAGQLPSCDVVQRPARIKLIFKGNGVGWRATNTWCMDGCNCALGEGIWVGSSFLFENMNDAVEAKRLALTLSDAFGGVEMHKTFGLGYWVTINGRLARSGRMQVRIDKHYRTIWYDEDDFVNTCINDGKKLYSSGGRLYCLSSEFNSSMKLLR
jgi:hypothetical protein